MDKAIVSTPLKRKTINYFKYEMQDTNQLLKDLVWYKMSQTLQPSRQNNSQKLYHDMFREDVCITKSENSTDSHSRKKNFEGRINETSYFQRIGSEYIKLEDQIQNQQNPIMTELLQENQNIFKRKKNYKLSQNANDIGDLIECNLSFDESQDQSKQKDYIHSIQRQKIKQIQNFGNDNSLSQKQSKKQKKGLANISLRVKNIVAQHKQLTYAQVTDLVIQHSKDQLNKLQANARTKQMKNIKRRVYDALNVLVALNVLKKRSKFVTTTDWTTVPGKVHSNQWENVTTKLNYVQTLKRDCHQKQTALKSLLQKYHTITALHLKHSQQAQTLQQRKDLIDNKLFFPVLMFCPVYDELIEVAIQQKQGSSSDMHVKVSGKNLSVFGDFDLSLQLQLSKYRDSIKQARVLQEIQIHAGQKVHQKSQSIKVQSQDVHGTNIDDIDNFFDEYLFEQK